MVMCAEQYSTLKYTESTIGAQRSLSENGHEQRAKIACLNEQSEWLFLQRQRDRFEELIPLDLTYRPGMAQGWPPHRGDTR